MSKRDYYAVLNVPRDADAIMLKRAYRELAMRYHPDQNPGNPEAEAKFKEVSEAYTVLSDSDTRSRYDRRGFDGVGELFDVKSFGELFDNLFGDLFGKKRGKVSGRDVRYTLELRFEEAALGCKKTIQFASAVDCSDCTGSGARPGGLKTCSACAGRGEVKMQQGFFSLNKRCATCAGRGKIITEVCERCRGAGLVNAQREYDVSIPPGTEEGSTRKVAGQGEPGRGGGMAGDLSILVHVLPHPFFRRQGEVIACEVVVTCVQAALGTVVQVPTLDGPVEMKVPPGTQPGAQFRLRQKGLPKQGVRGDQHVHLAIEVPTSLTGAQRALLEKLQSSLDDAQLPRAQEFRQKSSFVSAK